jgi:hypothetical protein
MQVPKLVDDEVEAAKGDLGTWLHLLNVVELEDETHLKCEEYVSKKPLLGAPTVRNISSGNIDQHTTHRESDGQHTMIRGLY